jgi:hypothetical protein
MLKKCLIVAVVVGCFSFVEAKAQDCPRTPVRNLIKKVQPVRTFFKKAYDARPLRTLFQRKPLRSLLKGRSCSGSYYKSEQIENSTVPIPLVPAPALIPDA